MAINFNASTFPIVTMRFLGTVSNQDITQASLQILGLLAKKQTFTLISDMTEASPSSEQGKALAAIMDQRRDEFRKYLVGNCLVIGNIATRALLRSALLRQKPPFPVVIEATYYMAEIWCQGQLGRTQVAPSGRIAAK